MLGPLDFLFKSHRLLKLIHVGKHIIITKSLPKPAYVSNSYAIGLTPYFIQSGDYINGERQTEPDDTVGNDSTRDRMTNTGDNLGGWVDMNRDGTRFFVSSYRKYVNNNKYVGCIDVYEYNNSAY